VKRPLRRSACVPLLLAGSVQLAGCDRPPVVLHDLYRSDRQCLADWGTAGGCSPGAAPDGTTAWFGPRYAFGNRQAYTLDCENRHAVQDVRTGNIAFTGQRECRQYQDHRGSSSSASGGYDGGRSTDAGATQRSGFGSSGRMFSGGG
jgi:hypothetical protein